MSKEFKFNIRKKNYTIDEIKQISKENCIKYCNKHNIDITPKDSVTTLRSKMKKFLGLTKTSSRSKAKVNKNASTKTTAKAVSKKTTRKSTSKSNTKKDKGEPKTDTSKIDYKSRGNKIVVTIGKEKIERTIQDKVYKSDIVDLIKLHNKTTDGSASTLKKTIRRLLESVNNNVEKPKVSKKDSNSMAEQVKEEKPVKQKDTSVKKRSGREW